MGNVKSGFAPGIPEIIHSPFEYAVAGRALEISAAFRAGAGPLPERLSLSLRGGKSFAAFLFPADSINAGGQSYEIYSGSLPAEYVCAPSVDYEIEGRPFSVPVLDASSFPHEVPLTITELYQRPKGRGIGSYVEVFNPSADDVDLFGYELLAYVAKTEATGEPDARLPLSDAEGKNILRPGECAAIWWLKPKYFGLEGRDWTTPADFCEDFCGEYGRIPGSVNPENSRIVPVDLTYIDPDTGKRKLRNEPGEIPFKLKPTLLLLVKRGGSPDDAFFRLLYNDIQNKWDNPVRRSSYWRTDPRDPGTAIRIANRETSTPGSLIPGQTVHNLSRQAPLIIPVAPGRSLYSGDTCAEVSFAAEDAGREGSVFTARTLFACGGLQAAVPAVLGDDGLFHSPIPAKILLGSHEIGFRIEVFDGTRTASFPASGFIGIPVYDNSGPEITSMLPTEGYAYDGRQRNTLRASFHDLSGVDLTSSKLFIDSKDVTDDAKWTETGVECPLNAATGDHKAVLILFDRLGNRTRREVNFSVSDMKRLNVYVGEVHAHTSDSDGTGTPPDAYEYARDTGRVDYFSTTEHSHYVSAEDYERQKTVADSFNEPGKFAALYGWEMTWNNTNGYWGHMNVLNCDEVIGDIDGIPLPELYQILKERHPEAVAMFNHPGYNWGNFDEFAYHSEDNDRVVCLSEIKGPVHDYEYMSSLSHGWHTSPVSNEDNHSPNWTTGTKMTGCVLAPALTRENVVDAFRARRTYTTSDRTMKIRYKVNGEWLGSRIEYTPKLGFDIAVSCESKRGIDLVEIVAEDGIVVAARSGSSARKFVWNPVLPADYDYYYLRITGPGQYCVTSPVWIEKRSGLEITPGQAFASKDETVSAVASFMLKNKSDRRIGGLRVSFYMSQAHGLRPYESFPFRTIPCGSLGPGEAVNVYCRIPEIPGVRRVTAIAEGKSRSRRETCTAFALMSPVSISAVLPDSSALVKDGQTFEDPFPYVCLCNSSTQPVSLEGGRLALWTDTGKAPSPAHTWPTNGITIPPRSSVVVWDRRDASLGEEDFNRRYGTSLKLGKDLFAADIRITDNSENGRRLELYAEGDRMSRVHWNYCSNAGERAGVDREIGFVYRPGISGTSAFGGISEPRPGYVGDGRMAGMRDVAPSPREDKKSDRLAARSAKAGKRREKAVLTIPEAAAAAAGAAIIAAAAILLRKKKN